MIDFRRTIPILRIFDAGKAKEFYVGFLGLAIDWEHRFDEGSPAYIQVTRGEFTLHLSEHHGDCCPGSTVFIWMEGIEDFHREINSKGNGFMRSGIEETFYGARSVPVIDPFGNRIRFDERLPLGGV